MTTPPPAEATASTPPAQESLLQTLKGLWQELPGLVSDRVELLSLELHRAGLALAQIAALVVAAAILGVTAWLVLWGMVVALLVMAGLHWLAALGLALLANLLAAWWAVARVRKLLPALKL
ncbi:MAG: phage holin family protein, partial [Hydrogenophaga sp.]|nr:phage holin family protein [Hydrogenophaga sp.]